MTGAPRPTRATAPDLEAWSLDDLALAWQRGDTAAIAAAWKAGQLDGLPDNDPTDPGRRILGDPATTPED